MKARLGERLLGIASVATLVIVAVMLGALAAGYRPVVIKTGSMGDTAPPGALVVAAPRSGFAIDVGDIVVMRRPGATPVTHRVIEVESAGANRFAITQGDANEVPDAAPYPLSTQEELVARWILPGMGSRLESIFRPGVALVLLGLAVMAVAASMLRRIWTPPAYGDEMPPELAEEPGPPLRASRRARVVAGAALPLIGILTAGAAWAFFGSNESVASNTFGTRDCFDPQLASVQNGETIHAVDGIVEVPITPVDPAEAFVLTSLRSSADEPADSSAAVSLRGDGAAVVISRATDAAPPTPVIVAWSVVHYDCGLTVQRGSTVGSDSSQLDVSISAVEPAASFVLVTSAALADATTFTGDDLVGAQLISPTNLRISVEPGANLPVARSYEWQVVSFDDPADASVQQVSGSLDSGVGSTSITLPSPVDSASTFLLASITSAGSGPDVGERLVRVHLVDSTTVAVDRLVAGEPVAVEIQAVTLKDGSTVRHGTVDLAIGQPTRVVAIDSTDLSRSTAISSVVVPGAAAGGMTDQASDDIVGEASASFILTGPTALEVQRATTASNASFGWQVIEWAGPGWWDPDYPFRQRIDVTTSSIAAPSQYTVPLTFDHDALISSGLSTSMAGDDVRVVRWDGLSWTELDRVLDDSSAWNGVSTTFWFRTVVPIAADDTSSYWLYLGSDSPGPPLADPEEVWLLTEGFESGTLGDFEDRTGGTGWYEADPWTRRIPLTIAAGQTTADLTDYPLLVSVTDADLGANAQPDGSDIRFLAADGVTPLPHEIDSWSPGGGSLEAWVRVPLLTAASPTTLYLAYGAPNAPTQSNVQGTWAVDVEAVWHLANDPGGDAPQLDDVTLNNHDGLGRGAMASDDLVIGLIGNALDFDGVDDHLEADPFDVGGAPALTLSAWVQLDTLIDGGRIVAKASDTSRQIFELSSLADGSLRARLSLDGATGELVAGSGSITTGSWYHVAATWDGTTLRLYVDGLEVGSGPASGTIDSDATMPVTLGNLATGARPLDGRLDEVRVETTARSGVWLHTTHKNQSAPGSFAVAGPPQSGAWLSQGAWTARKPISIDPAVVASDLANFALPINIIDSEIQASANGDGSDIVFTDADGTTRLDHVIEVWDAGTGALTAWVRVPSLSASSATQLFVYYANPTAADQQDGASVFGPVTDLALLGTP